MDKLDEWMKRAIDEKSLTPLPQQKKEPQKPFKKPEQPFKFKGKFQQKNYQKPRVNGPVQPQKPNAQNANFRHNQNKKQNMNQKQNQRPPQNQVPKQGVALKQSTIIKDKLKIIPLGGLNEIGKNMMAFEYENDIIIIDMGLEFPSEDLFGIDYVIPDVTYLEENRKRIRGVIITHGHLDHTGGIPYILPKLDFPPVYATKLTLGLITKRIEEFKIEKFTQLREIKPNEPLRLGKFLLHFFYVTHSIPDAVGVVIETPIGKLVNPGDFKFDDFPLNDKCKTDVIKLNDIGKQNILGLFCEATNALEKGHSLPEREVGKVIDGLISYAPGRIIITSFASQIDRIQQIMDAAVKHNRKIYISGKSMKDNIDIATRLGYLHHPANLINDIKKYKDANDKETLILTTGSQGEAVSALTRMANKEHAQVKVKKGDTIILSSSPIIGNEQAIHTVINNLSIMGARVIHGEIMDIHTSGHAKQEELLRMINCIKPKYLIPVHGQYYMRQALAELARAKCGIPAERIIMIQNGDVLLADRNTIAISPEKIETKYILIDGSGEGKLGSQVQVEREIMSQNGTLVILIHITKKTHKLKKTPDIVSRGFIYMHETEEVANEITRIAGDAYRKVLNKNPRANRKDIKLYIKQTIDKYTRTKLERRPLIIPLIIES